jgi:hypothetical protein
VPDRVFAHGFARRCTSQDYLRKSRMNGMDYFRVLRDLPGIAHCSAEKPMRPSRFDPNRS